MQLRTAFTIVLSAAAAAVIASACEPTQEFCAPKLGEPGPGPDANPECSECIADQCGNAGENCVGECEAYGKCTCECAEDDLACFESCSAGRSESCVACQEDNSNALFECASQRCGVCGFGGGEDSASASGGEAGGDDNADSSPWSDSGSASWSDDGGESWSDSGGASWSDDGGADDASSYTDGGESSSGAACEQLHAQCCPQLEGFDLELCRDATDEASCQLWLDIFTEEGSC